MYLIGQATLSEVEQLRKICSIFNLTKQNPVAALANNLSTKPFPFDPIMTSDWHETCATLFTVQDTPLSILSTFLSTTEHSKNLHLKRSLFLEMDVQIKTEPLQKSREYKDPILKMVPFDPIKK